MVFVCETIQWVCVCETATVICRLVFRKSRPRSIKSFCCSAASATAICAAVACSFEIESVRLHSSTFLPLHPFKKLIQFDILRVQIYLSISFHFFGRYSSFILYCHRSLVGTIGSFRFLHRRKINPVKINYSRKISANLKSHTHTHTHAHRLTSAAVCGSAEEQWQYQRLTVCHVWVYKNYHVSHIGIQLIHTWNVANQPEKQFSLNICDTNGDGRHSNVVARRRILNSGLWHFLFKPFIHTRCRWQQR